MYLIVHTVDSQAYMAVQFRPGQRTDLHKVEFQIVGPDDFEPHLRARAREIARDRGIHKVANLDDGGPSATA